MGIKSLTKLIKVNSPDSIETSQLYKLSGKRVAIDASLFIYQCLINVRYNGESLKNKNDKITSHISGIFYKTINYLSMNITPIYIFDGKPPEEKDEIIKNRQERVESAKAGLEKATTDIEKEKYEKQCIRLTKTHIDDIKRLLDLMGVTYLHIDGEGEAIASELCRIGYVDYVITEDMDTLPFGCPNLIRNCLDRSQKRKDLISIINLEKLLSDIKLTYEQFVELCILCGCDYCSNIQRVGNVKALSIIKEFGSIEKFIESNPNYNIPEDYIKKYNKAKELFMLYKDKLKPEELPFHNSNRNISELITFLIKECSISEKRVYSAIKKMQYTY